MKISHRYKLNCHICSEEFTCSATCTKDAMEATHSCICPICAEEADKLRTYFHQNKVVTYEEKVKLCFGDEDEIIALLMTL